MMTGIIRNAVENTPDKGRIDIAVTKKDSGVRFTVHDFGVGIESDAQKRIFEGFFTTQETLLYSTKTPFAFNAGGKGADLLRMKIFSDRHGFVLKMESQRCRFLLENEGSVCPGDNRKMRILQESGGLPEFRIFNFYCIFPGRKKNKKILYKPGQIKLIERMN